jgi:hypothetical protein
MMNRREFVAGAMLAAGASKRLFALGVAPSAGGFEAELDNVMDHPFYAWPETLLVYPIASADEVKGKRLVETVSGRGVACQVFEEDGQAKIAFLSDLPAGAKKTFKLVDGTGDAPAMAVKVTHEARAIVLDSGKMQVRIPVSQAVTGEAPGPILAVARGGEWHGASTVSIKGHRVTQVETTAVIEGPLVAEYRVLYRVEGGGSYVVNVRCNAGYEFLRVREDMEGMPEWISGVWEFDWKGTEFTHRHAVNHPYPFAPKPVPGWKYEDYGWEPIETTQMNTHIGMAPALDASGAWVVSLGIYQPWPIFTVQTGVCFWTGASSDTGGIFIDRAEDWADHEYAIWHGSAKLKVRFKYADGALKWMYPLARGKRATCFSFYDHKRDVEALEKLAATNTAGIMWKGSPYRSSFFATSHTLAMQNMYGTLDLDQVKDWVLTYPDDGRLQAVLFDASQPDQVRGIERSIAASGPVSELPISGTRQSAGINPSQSGGLIYGWVPALNRLLPQMDPALRRKMAAMTLMMIYIHASEGYMPMGPMLSGHPNFLAEVESTMGGLAFLFPDHPMAPYWAAQWDAYLELNTRYHTRPAVREWEARGGRWTENLGTYVWGFLVPSLHAAYVLKHMDGREHFAHGNVVPIADWLVNALSAPYKGESAATLATINPKDQHNWGLVHPEYGARRVHPPQGAHSERRMAPREMWYLGVELQNFAPLTAEALMWAARPGNDPFERRGTVPDMWQVMVRGEDNLGTNPHLRSAKFTGYGMVLRAGVNTPAEVSLHLEQIDDGPNYRWGVPAEGGCGLLYYFAAGQAYSHNGFEDAGDRRDQDTDFCTNFGVWKGTEFYSVGQNLLTEPLRDLGVAQYAELRTRQGATPYSWPEYESRSVLLVGTDYFVLYDKVFNQLIMHRLSWFVRKGDPFPSITFLHGQEAKHVETAYTEVATKTTDGRWYDGLGDSVAVVTHRGDLQVVPDVFGCRVTGPGVKDVVFRSRDEISFAEGGVTFEGSTGVVRQRDGEVEIALMQGKRIGAGGYSLEYVSGSVAFSAVLGADGSLRGRFHAAGAGAFRIRSAPGGARRLYVNGVEAGRAQDGGVLVDCDQGLHAWEYVAGLPTPVAPRVVRTEYVAGGVKVLGERVAGATIYSVETSEDNAATWVEVAKVAPGEAAVVTGLKAGRKYHVRLIARNPERSGVVGPEYPVYATDRVPAVPAGLRVDEANGAAIASWGEVLGVSGYRLYALDKSGGARVLYAGLDRSHRLAGAGPWEIAVSAVTGLGEGKRSASRVHPDPYQYHAQETADKRFRRTPTYGIVDDITPMPNDGMGSFYPE